jgi:hypothetical protein
VGQFSVSGNMVAESDLRQRPFPPPSEDSSEWSVGEADWMIAASMREDENLTEDVDDAQGLEGMTFPDEMARWVRDVLGLTPQLFPCWVSGELEALEGAHRAVEAGGVAFLLIDNKLIKPGEDVTESHMYWQSRKHAARSKPGNWSQKYHSQDDAIPPNHWVVYLGELTPENPSEVDQIVLKLWSWGSEYKVTGLADDFGEYLYAVVAGRP